MKKILATLALGLGLTSCQAQTEFSKESLTSKLTTTDNKDISFEEILNQNEGKTVVIEVWASWCGDCVKAMPKVKEMQATHTNVDYVFISMDKTADKWKSGIEKHALVGDHYMANDQMKGVFGKAMDIDWIPRYIIVDKTGKIVLYRAIETDFDKINETLESLK